MLLLHGCGGAFDTQAQRRLDALGALRWLTGQPGVDGRRLVLLGWSDGGSTVLAATNRLHRVVARAAIAPRAAVTFYPGCEAELARRHVPTAPTLLLVGERRHCGTRGFAPRDARVPAPPAQRLSRC